MISEPAYEPLRGQRSVSKRSLFETLRSLASPKMISHDFELGFPQTMCSETRSLIKVSLLDNTHELWNNRRAMAAQDKKKKRFKAKIAVALQSELGRVPTEEEIDNIFLTARVMYKAVLGLHFLRQKQKKTGQLAIF